MGLIDRFRTFLSLSTVERAAVIPPWPSGVDNFWPFMNFGGNTYPLNQTISFQQEEIADTFDGFAGAYLGNSIVFALMQKRSMLFSEARFQYQRMTKGRPGDLWGDVSLAILEHPWPNGTTGDLLTRAIQHVDLGGNFYAAREREQIHWMRPNWVDIVIGSNSDPDVVAGDFEAEMLGIIYYPGGRYSGRSPKAFAREQIAHWAPLPDPRASYRGMSWLSPIIRDIMGDSAATTHKIKFFENGATPNLVVKRKDTLEKGAFKEWVSLMEAGHAGTANAYKTLYLDSGSDATVVGSHPQQMEFALTQGKAETRMAAASGIHPAVAGLSEGLQGASLNAGNFGAARRLVADSFLRPMWRNFAGSMETIVKPPAGNRLWYDDRDIAFLREDRKDAADIQQIKAQSIRQLVDAGYKPETVVAAVEAEDMSLLRHSGLFSVQLQPPGTTAPAADGTMPTDMPTNGQTPMPPQEAPA
jgi:phage portal protein BeeE